MCIVFLYWISDNPEPGSIKHWFSTLVRFKQPNGNGVTGLKPHVHAVQCTRSTSTPSTPTSCSRRLSVRNVLYLFILMGISMFSAVGYYKPTMNTLIYAEHIYVILYIYINLFIIFQFIIDKPSIRQFVNRRETHICIETNSSIRQ